MQNGVLAVSMVVLVVVEIIIVSHTLRARQLMARETRPGSWATEVLLVALPAVFLALLLGYSALRSR